MFSKSLSHRRRTIGALIGVGTLVAATQVGGLGSPSVQAVDDPATPDIVEWQSDVEVFSTDDIIGSSDVPDGQTGNREAQDPTIVLGNDPGEFDDLNFSSQGGNVLSPIDNSFTTDELDFFGATGRDRDGDPLTGDGYDEGFAGNILDAGEIVGLEVSDVATDLFKAGAPLGTWAAGLGNESIKASTEHFTVMESILTCYQTNPYDFWKSQADYEAGLPPVPAATATALAEQGLSCPQLTTPTGLDDLAGNPIDLDALTPNEDSVIRDIAVDPDNAYSVTKKDDGKLLFRWGTSVKRPTDIRFQKSIELPEDWTDPALAGTRGYRVTRAELILNHNITNNPNDQIRPEDWENEAATGRTPDYEIDGSGNWVSTTACYEGDGDFIPAGTILRDPANTVGGIPASDLEFGFTPAWYTTIQRDPFQWSFRDLTTGAKVGAQTPAEIAAAQADPNLELVSGPRWRMTSNKFGQDLPGLEIPAIECSQPPYQKGTIRYETGEPITTTINLLDWGNDADDDRWENDPASSPLAYSAGWITTWSGIDTVPGQVIDPVEDALRCADTIPTTGDCVTELGTTLTDGFDVSFYVKGDIKPAQIYDVQLILEYEAEPMPALALDYGDAPDTYGTTIASSGASATVTDTSPKLGDLVDTEVDGLPTIGATGDDSDNTDDEDGVSFSELKGATQGTATVALTGTGYVSGWIDFNADGDFADAGEQVVTDATAGGALAVAVPADATAGATFARFRVTDVAGAGPTGYVGDGEVEDHAVTIVAADVTPPPPPPDPTASNAFLPLTPTRVLDTRNSTALQLGDWNGVGPLQGGSTVAIPVRSVVPTGSPVAVVNVTTTRSTAPGFITVYPCDTPLPNASNLNYLPGQDRAALAYAPVSAAGQVCVYSSATTDVIVDVSGYTPNGGYYSPRTPQRLADTRATGPLAPNATLRVTPPATGGDALAISVTSVNAATSGFLTAYSCADGLPNISTLNYTAGTAIANLTIVGNGDICVTTSAQTDVLVDLQGEVTEPVALGKARLLDTRSGAKPAAGSTTTFDPTSIAAFAGSPMAAVNVTATRATGPGFLTVWNCADALPNASALNYLAGDTFAIANLAMVKTTSPICVYTSAPTDIIIDLVAVTP